MRNRDTGCWDRRADNLFEVVLMIVRGNSDEGVMREYLMSAFCESDRLLIRGASSDQWSANLSMRTVPYRIFEDTKKDTIQASWLWRLHITKELGSNMSIGVGVFCIVFDNWSIRIRARSYKGSKFGRYGRRRTLQTPQRTLHQWRPSCRDEY